MVPIFFHLFCPSSLGLSSALCVCKFMIVISFNQQIGSDFEFITVGGHHPCPALPCPAPIPVGEWNCIKKYKHMSGEVSDLIIRWCAEICLRDIRANSLAVNLAILQHSHKQLISLCSGHSAKWERAHWPHKLHTHTQLPLMQLR